MCLFIPATGILSLTGPLNLIGSHPLSDKALEVKRRDRKLTEENPQAVLRGQLIEKYGAGGENRTLMGQSPRDFESRASTSFTTPA